MAVPPVIMLLPLMAIRSKLTILDEENTTAGGGTRTLSSGSQEDMDEDEEGLDPFDEGNSHQLVYCHSKLTNVFVLGFIDQGGGFGR